MFFFFFNDTATTEIYTLSLHDALPICRRRRRRRRSASSSALLPARLRADVAGVDPDAEELEEVEVADDAVGVDRKSTRLNSSHANISYAVFCLKKKKTSTQTHLVYPFM